MTDPSIPREKVSGPYDEGEIGGTLFAALLRARAKWGPRRDILVDTDDRGLSYGQIVQGALALGHALTRRTTRGEHVGLFLPTGAGAAITFFGLSAYGRVPAILNFTSGAAGIASALATAKVTRIVTARRFIELGKFEAMMASLPPGIEVIHLEDVRAGLTLCDKAAAVAGVLAPGLVTRGGRNEDCAAILFTSGTEGEPKGVALSHRNILSNVQQVRAHLDLFADDVLFNPLPVFHSFGLTVGTLMPLFVGIKQVCHPTPRQPREIVRRVAGHGASILLSTDTFIGQYARVAERNDFACLRLIVCGAERVREETRVLLRRDFGKEILEGYGVTEASPVVAANRPGAMRLGTVGQAVTRLETELVPVEGIAAGGQLRLRGPNIMMGYMHADAPGVIVPPADGWHDTGDVVDMDAEGFIAIKGRLKRFAKIGGEKISLALAENCAHSLWPEHTHAAVSVPDGRKGEQIVMATDAPGATRDALLSWARNHGVPEIALPRTVRVVTEVPLLGSGKIDYPQVERLFRDTNEHAS